MNPNLESIRGYKNKLLDIKSKENDFNITDEKLNRAKHLFETIKQRRYEEFMDGYNTISSKLKEMYQVKLN
jgi:structural maintenance of chromosome 4